MQSSIKSLKDAVKYFGRVTGWSYLFSKNSHANAENAEIKTKEKQVVIRGRSKMLALWLLTIIFGFGISTYALFALPLTPTHFILLIAFVFGSATIILDIIHNKWLDYKLDEENISEMDLHGF